VKIVITATDNMGTLTDVDEYYSSYILNCIIWSGKSVSLKQIELLFIISRWYGSWEVNTCTSVPIKSLYVIECELHVWSKLHQLFFFILPAIALWPMSVTTTVLGEYESNCLFWFTKQLRSVISQYYMLCPSWSDAKVKIYRNRTHFNRALCHLT